MFLSDMHLSDFLCAFLDQCNIQGRKKSSPIGKLNSQNLAIFTAKCGKSFHNFVAKLGISNGKFSAMPEWAIESLDTLKMSDSKSFC